jgi:hypothetical protein
MSTIITVEGDTVEKRVITKYGGKVTREDIFTSSPSANTRRTEWTYLRGAKATATYEAGKRQLDISSPGNEIAVFKTVGQVVGSRLQSTTTSVSGPTISTIGNKIFAAGSTVSDTDSSFDTSYTTTRENDTTEVGTQKTGITNTATNPGQIPGAIKTDQDYEVYDHFGQTGGKKTGEGSCSTEYDPTTGRSHSESFETTSDGTSIYSSTDTDGNGNITTTTIVATTDDSGRVKTEETNWTTNADGSESRTTTSSASDGTKTVETVAKDKNGVTTTKTETYDKDGKMTDDKTSQGDTSKASPADHPDGTSSGYPNPDGPDDPPSPAAMGPADVLYTGYLGNINAFLGGSSMSQGAFTDLGDPPPFTAISAAMVSDVGSQNGQVLASGVAVNHPSDPDLNPRALVQAMQRLSLVSTQSAGFAAVLNAASLIQRRN